MSERTSSRSTRSESDVVFVCLGENPDNGVHVEEVYSTLEEAQKHMRRAFYEYKRDNPDADIEWNAGEATGHWGWFDTNCQNGFYIHGKKVLNGQDEEGNQVKEDRPSSL